REEIGGPRGQRGKPPPLTSGQQGDREGLGCTAQGLPGDSILRRRTRRPQRTNDLQRREGDRIRQRERRKSAWPRALRKEPRPRLVRSLDLTRKRKGARYRAPRIFDSLRSTPPRSRPPRRRPPPSPTPRPDP